MQKYSWPRVNFCLGGQIFMGQCTIMSNGCVVAWRLSVHVYGHIWKATDYMCCASEQHSRQIRSAVAVALVTFHCVHTLVYFCS